MSSLPKAGGTDGGEARGEPPRPYSSCAGNAMVRAPAGEISAPNADGSQHTCGAYSPIVEMAAVTQHKVHATSRRLLLFSTISQSQHQANTRVTCQSISSQRNESFFKNTTVARRLSQSNGGWPHTASDCC
ncbi:hypothetical protein BaRGS_00034335 [Batillaria attramentaria]|uniref:Uncharacterized protein n=1 Tax=Batillaria attramentaria TaxID=370345 RepID=A0ABD0JHQ7_9CAEN